jgi:hypothetical protein
MYIKTKRRYIHVHFERNQLKMAEVRRIQVCETIYRCTGVISEDCTKLRTWTGL